MTAYVALLRAVNVGGTGKLPMAELARLCEQLGFGAAKTYIASGNVVFTSDATETAVKQQLQHGLKALGLPDPHVLVRSAAEMQAVLHDNPFDEADPKQTIVLFCDAAPVSTEARHQTREEIRAGRRELYVCYHGGIGASKLVLGAASKGTGRNLNTVKKLTEMALERTR